MGTFAGVFTPSVLTILGIILFRRLGYVVGKAGLIQAMVIVALANVIAVLTSISVAAVATNLRVKGGGDYYVISRTLGVEFGGAIGLVLFFAQSLSIAFYCIGFGEALATLLPYSHGQLPSLIAFVATFVLCFFAWGGADWATKLQFVIMALLVLSLVSFFWGGVSSWDGQLLKQSLDAPEGWGNFWIIFAIFFPAVTGFTQGISMSGDLKDPGASIPLGTFLAVGISILVYCLAALMFAVSMPLKALSSDYEAMRNMSRFAWLIDAGVIGATLSSAMASFMGAPRILQALAKDNVFPFLNFFAQGEGETNNPRRGILLSLGIALLTIALGDLNLIAPIVSMFFLISYGLLNYATFFEIRAASPSFRPRFQWCNQYTSMAGALGCFLVMMAIDFKAGLMAISVLAAVYYYIKHSNPVVPWADSRRSYSFQVIREELHSMSSEVTHPRNWRPVILAFSDEAEGRRRLLNLSSWLEGGAGLTSVVQVIESKVRAPKKEIDELENEINLEIKKSGCEAYPLVISAPDLHNGLRMLLQSFGVGPLRANIVMLEWPEGHSANGVGTLTKRYSRYLRETVELGCNVIAFKSAHTLVAGKTIDVWWNDSASANLVALLAHLMTRTEKWQEAKIRIISPRKDANEGYVAALEKQIEEMRIEAQVIVLPDGDEEKVIELSKEATFVFVPAKLRRGKAENSFGYDWMKIMSQLQQVACVIAAQDIDLTAEPEEGQPAELAKVAGDALAAEKEASEAEAKARQLEEKVEEKESESAGSASGESEELTALEKEAKQATEQARHLRKKAEKKREKAEKKGALAPELEEGAVEEAALEDSTSESDEESAKEK